MVLTFTPTPAPSGRTFSGSRWNSLMKRDIRSLPLTHQRSQNTYDVMSEPRRMAGSMVSAVISRRLSLDRAVHSFTGSGPTAAALRLTSALHEMHCNWLVDGSKVPPCSSDHLNKVDAAVPVTHRLMWVCNGFCSQCRAAYVPMIIDKTAQLSEVAEKALVQLARCIRPSKSVSKIGHAALYLRLIIESRILSLSMIRQLDLLDDISSCCEALRPNPPHELSALRGALEALQDQFVSGEHLEGASKKLIARVPSGEDAALVLERYFSRLSKSEDLDITFTAYSQLLTYVCHSTKISHPGVTTGDDLLDAIDRARAWPGIPKYLITHSTNAYLWTAGVDAGDKAQILEGHTKMIISVAFSLGGAQLVSGAQDGTLRLWIADHRTSIMFNKGDSGRVKFTSDGQMIAPSTIGGVGVTLRLSDDAAGRKTLCAQRASHRRSGFTISPEGQQDAHWDTPTGDVLGLHTKNIGGVVEHCNLGHEVAITSAAFSPDCKHIVSGTRSGAMVLWRIIPGQVDQVGALRGHRDAVNAVAFSADGAQIASGSRDRSLRLWDPKASRQTAVWYGPWATSLAFSPDGAHLVCGSQDRTVQLWDVKTGHLITVLKGHTSPVLTVTFSPNGFLIASSSEDHIIRLWNITKILNAKKLALEAAMTEEEWTVISEEEWMEYDSD